MFLLKSSDSFLLGNSAFSSGKFMLRMYTSSVIKYKWYFWVKKSFFHCIHKTYIRSVEKYLLDHLWYYILDISALFWFRDFHIHLYTRASMSMPEYPSHHYKSSLPGGTCHMQHQRSCLSIFTKLVQHHSTKLYFWKGDFALWVCQDLLQKQRYSYK